jgi:hypothetical protein
LKVSFYDGQASLLISYLTSFHIQMFGAFFYGFVDRDEDKSYRKIAYLADKMDKNDYMFVNSPYSLAYERPASRGPVLVNSSSPPSPPMKLDSPPMSTETTVRQREVMGPQTSDDPGVEGIDQFGTNTFQIYGWMVAPAFRPNPTATDAAEESGVGEVPSAPLSPNLAQDIAVDAVQTVPRPQDLGEDIETDDEWDQLQLEASRRAGQRSAAHEFHGPSVPVVGEADILLVQETQPKPSGPQEGDILIIVSDDEPIDHPHSSDDDEDADGPPKIQEMKPVVAPNGVIVKVEKDWWAMDKEKRDKRIARQARKDAKDKALEDAVASTQAAQKRLVELEEESNAKYFAL